MMLKEFLNVIITLWLFFKKNLYLLEIHPELYHQ